MDAFWYWLLLSLGLLIIEAKTATLNFLFLSAAAALTGAAVFFGLDSGWPAFLLFGVSSLGGILTLRNRIRAAMGKTEPFAIDVNQVLTASETIDPQHETQISYQGSLFTALNVGGVLIKAGDQFRIIKTEGIKLHVEKIQ